MRPQVIRVGGIRDDRLLEQGEFRTFNSSIKLRENLAILQSTDSRWEDTVERMFYVQGYPRNFDSWMYKLLDNAPTKGQRWRYKSADPFSGKNVLDSNWDHLAGEATLTQEGEAWLLRQTDTSQVIDVPPQITLPGVRKDRFRDGEEPPVKESNVGAWVLGGAAVGTLLLLSR